MKYIKILSAAALALAMGACDNVEEPERYIPIEVPKSDKVILIEEFTGSRCPNCPKGAETVAALHAQYGDQVIAVSLYPEQLAQLTRPFPNNVDLRSQIATDLFAQYNKDNALPAAMFNRESVNGVVLHKDVPTWGSIVTNLFNKDAFAPANIELATKYDATTRELTVNYDCLLTQDISDAVSFQIYVVENGITSRQSSTSGIIDNYVNNHVLRAGLNGTWGEDLGGNLKQGDKITDSVTTTLAADWVAENIQVIGFLCYTGGNRTILHATMAKSITE